MIETRNKEKAKLSMKRTFMLSTFSFLFLTAVLIVEVGFLTWAFISMIMVSVFYILIYVLRSAHWHLVAESIGGGSFIAMPILALLVEVDRGNIVPDDMGLYIVIGFLVHLFFGALYVIFVDIPAWKRSSDVNLKRKINLEEGSFDIAYPWYFSGAAMANDRAKTVSFIGVGAATGPFIVAFLGAGFIYVALVFLIALSAVMFWHRIYFAGLLIWLGKKHGRPILLSIYR